MTYSPFVYLLFVLLSTLCMSYFSMQEMAIISCNRLRLEVAARRGDKKSNLILNFLKNPSLLFGTTLVGVNLFLVISSEAARQLFFSMGISPNYSPVIYIPYVLIMGELVPMFIARACPEKISRLGVSLLYFLSRIIGPIFLPLHKGMQKFTSYFSPSLHSHHVHLVRDELFKLIEEAHLAPAQESPNRVGLLSECLFQGKQRALIELKLPLPITAHPSQELPRLRLDDTLFFALQTLYQMDAECGLLVDEDKKEIGLVAREDIRNQLFLPAQSIAIEKMFIDKTLDAACPLEEFAEVYKIGLPSTNVKTFQEILEKVLDRKPRVGDTILFGPLDITVVKAGVLGAKKIKVKTHRW